MAYAEAVGPIQGHPSCVRCGYDLHRQTSGARCPECGLHVWRSLRKDGLDESSAAWRRKVAWGARLIAFAFVAMVVGLWRTLTADAAGPFEGSAFGVSAALLSAGGWLSSASEQRGGKMRPGAPFRRSVRVGAGLILLAGALLISDRVLGHHWLRPASVLVGLCVMPWIGVVFWHVYRISRRGMNRKIVKWTGGLVPGAAAGTGVVPLLVFRPAWFPLRINDGVVEEVAWIGVLYCVAAFVVLWTFADACADVPVSAEPERPERRGVFRRAEAPMAP